MEITDAAICRCHWVPASSTKSTKPTGRVRIFMELMAISGQKKLFQFFKKVISATVASAGFDKGRKMLDKMRKRLQPSIKAASSNEIGDG